jgi:hypothetical protein
MVIRRITSAVVTRFLTSRRQGKGRRGPTGALPRHGPALAADGSVYVADIGNAVVRRIIRQDRLSHRHYTA